MRPNKELRKRHKAYVQKFGLLWRAYSDGNRLIGEHTDRDMLVQMLIGYDLQVASTRT